MIPLDDRGLLLGDGLFETLLAVDGVLRDEAAHLTRLADGARAMGLPAPDPAVAAAQMRRALGELSGRAAVRLSYTAGSGGRGLDRADPPSPVLFATAFPAPAWSRPARLALVSTRRNEGSPASRLKTLSYADNVLARREALAAGADEAAMLNNAGHIAGAAAANLFWLDGETLCTPSLDCGVLAGTKRAAVLARAKAAGLAVREDRFEASVLAGAKGVFLTNSLIGLRPASSLDGAPIGSDGLEGALFAALTDRSYSG